MGNSCVYSPTWAQYSFIMAALLIKLDTLIQINWIEMSWYFFSYIRIYIFTIYCMVDQMGLYIIFKYWHIAFNLYQTLTLTWLENLLFLMMMLLVHCCFMCCFHFMLMCECSEESNAVLRHIIEFTCNSYCWRSYNSQEKWGNQGRLHRKRRSEYQHPSRPEESAQTFICALFEHRSQ